MGVRQDEEAKGYTKSQIYQKQVERLDEYYGEPPALSLGQQHWENEKKRIEDEQLRGQPPKALIDTKLSCFSCSD